MIRTKEIRKSFGTLEVLKGIDLLVERGEVVSIVGPSGAGKTTLLQILGTLSRPSSGEIEIDGEAVHALSDRQLSRFRNTKIGFVFQFHHLLPEFTALENVCIPGYIGGRDRREVEKRAAELLEMLGMEHRSSHKPAELSGGEQQRVAIARALINSPAVLLADEPSGNLDTKNREEIHRLFFTLRDTLGQTVVIVTHDGQLAAMSDRKIEMVDGKPSPDMIPEPIRELLDELYERYDTPGFIEDDPISVPHGFTRREDIEIAGFLAATIAWGNRRSIVRNGRKLMELMDRSPYDFTMNASRNELLPLLDFVHRTFNGGDCIDFIGALRGICLRDGSLGGYFKREYAETGDLRTVLSRFRTAFWSADHRPRAEKHLSSIDRGASCKRLCMYLKWMVRDDGRGVDFGLWKSIPPAALYLPLDVHTGHMGRALGLLVRKQNDWKAVEEITASLRTLDASDPVRYDFALFGAGIDGFLK